MDGRRRGSPHEIEPERPAPDASASLNGNARGRVARGREGSHVVEMQRRRLLTATVEVVFERGAQGLTAATVCKRSGLSRRTFYDIFQDREECLLAAFEDGMQQATRAVAQAATDHESWREQIRAGLTELLSFLDREPGIARLLIVDALGSGDRTLNARKHALTQIIAIVEQGRTEARAGREPPPLTAEGIVGAVFSVIHARLLEREQRPLMELAGPLMAMIAQPYLGPTAARRELERPTPIERPSTPRLPADPFKDLPMRLTYRTARVLTSIAATPGASNKHVARAAGIADEGQTSKLLARLQRNGLIQDTGSGPVRGLPRAWTLTERGESVLQAVGG
jgi:AcrR family transcriptional regulator